MNTNLTQMATFLTLPSGITLHYDGAGAGEPLILIHALGTDLRLWDALAPLLTTFCTVKRYDLRGHGLSSAPPAPYSLRDHVDDLRGLLDHTGVEKATLCGVSVGGLIAMQFALDHPQRVARLVLCDTDARIGSAALWENRIKLVRERGLDTISPDILARWFAPNYREKNPAAWEGWRTLLARQNAEGYSGTCVALRDADIRDQVGNITIPTQVIVGEQDVSVTVDAARTLAAALPNAEMRVIDDCGHLPPIEQPESLFAAIRDFMREGDAYERGMAIRRSVLGDTHVDRAEANKTAFDSDFQHFITEMAWGNVWSRGGIDRPTRHMLTLAVLAALGREPELAMHLRATRNTGVTLEQLREVFFQVAIYAGVPAANSAFSLAKRELTDHD
ncbi:MAG: 3-oxoadipate enol-lactonase [bacterium]|nr:3-oxoadipate enol-lactonase [bacterium]